MKQILLFALLISLLPTGLRAQERAVVKARLVNKQTREALPYSTIYLPGRKTGTVANGEGRFVLHVNNPIATDSLVLSSVGYVSLRVPLAKLLQQADEQTIGLQPTVAQLREVVVRPLDPVELVQQAMRRVPKNYPATPALLTGFYREWVREKAFLVLSEGQLELYKSSYSRRIYDDAVRMLKGRRKPLANYFLSGTDTCRIPDITNGPHLGIMLDVVKNTGLDNFLLPDGPSLYDYTYAGQTTVNDRSVYVIEFTPKDPLFVNTRGQFNAAIFAGKLLIDVQTLAIVKADFTLSKNGLRIVNQDINLYKFPIRLESRRYMVSYQPLDDRYVLSHVQVENNYTYVKHPAQPIQTKMDFVVTQTTFDNVQKLNKKEVIKRDQSFTEQLMRFDDSFWDNDNILVEEP